MHFLLHFFLIYYVFCLTWTSKKHLFVTHKVLSSKTCYPESFCFFCLCLPLTRCLWCSATVKNLHATLKFNNQLNFLSFEYFKTYKNLKYNMVLWSKVFLLLTGETKSSQAQESSCHPETGNIGGINNI